MTFKLYGPGDTTCTGATLVNESKALGTVSGGVAMVTSSDYTPTAVGTYRWIANYSGDAKNLAVSGACNDANESTW